MSETDSEGDNLRPKKPIDRNLTNMYTGVPTADYDGAKQEKPYQRETNQKSSPDEDEYVIGLECLGDCPLSTKPDGIAKAVTSCALIFTRKERINPYIKKGRIKFKRRVPSPFIVILFGFYCLLGYFAQFLEDDMPKVIKEADVPRDNSHIFSEESAWKYLDHILGHEPRVAGTRYHLNKTMDVKAMVDIIASNANMEVRTDWQLVTGNYYLNSSAPFVNYYQNASNIIALLVGESGFHPNGTIGTSVLFNCHYDSVPYAMGASDNAVFCAVLAEALNKLSRRRDKLKHNIIFLFNGAEENPLQASHGFLQHPWARGVTAVVNLDAAGMNGKSSIFQVTDPRILTAYKRVVKIPNAQGLGEFLFSSGIIPSDTDFRIFKDFGDIQGIDIAFVKWGHVYHTRYDHPELIKEGVIQCAGDMILVLATDLGDFEDLQEKIEPTTAVYYDYMNLFLISYSLPASYAVDFFIALFGISTVLYYLWLVGLKRSSLYELMFAVGGRLICLVCGIVVAAIFVLIMVATTTQMRYMSRAWLVVPLYWMPYLVTAVLVSQYYDGWRASKNGFNRSIRTLQGLAATRLILSIVLLVLLCIPGLVTTRYLFSAPLFILSLTSLISLTVVRYFRMPGWQHLLLEVALSVPSCLFAMSLSLRLDAMMLPIMGRSSSSTPDYTVALINLGLVILVSSTVAGIELLFSKKGVWILAAPWAITSIVLMFIPFSPYQNEGPSTQRHYWFHTQIITQNFNNETVSITSGLVVSKMDPYSTETVLPALIDNGLNYNSRTDFNEDCERYIYCNLPLYRTSFARSLPKALFIYTGPPAVFDPVPSLRVVSRTCLSQVCTYVFSMIGTVQNTITLWPYENVAMTSWSWSAPMNISFVKQDRPVYVILHSVATYAEVLQPVEFSVTFNVPLSLQGGPIIDVSHHAHKMYNPEDYTAEYRRILTATPEYFNVASILTFRYNYVF